MNQLQTNTKLTIITPVDPHYEFWNNRGANARLKGAPSRIIPVSTIAELTNALQKIVNEGSRLAIRGGGHCLENFVSDDAVEVIIDISMMKGISYDPKFNAIEIMAGVTLGEMHEKLCNDWGILLPSGEHPAIGIGGHIQGGAFGFICREYGLGADYLYAAEVLWINKNGQVEKSIATLEGGDPNRELWWAHTGGGAGNFGVVTRYWFKTPGVLSRDPSELLPRAPGAVETAEIDWSWNDIDEEKFKLLVDNFGRYCQQHAGYDAPARTLFATLHLWNKSSGKIQIKALLINEQLADTVLQGLINALHTGIDIPYHMERKKLSWLEFAVHPFPDIFTDAKGCFKLKDAFLLEPFTLAQIDTIYHYLTSIKDVPGGFLGLATYGGKVNTVAPDATASFQRNAIMTTACVGGWINDEEEKKYLEWVRGCYKNIYAETGGAPVPGKQAGGCIIAHPDNDLTNPEFNRSGIPWYAFYYQDNYPRLQKVKTKWDPLNIFTHALSVQGL